jgi:hypothetical protein
MSAILLGVIAASSATCGRDTMSPGQIVKVVRSAIVVGMTRSEVETKLASLRGLPIKYVYVPRHMLELVRQARFEGRELSGRFDVETPHEAGVVDMKHAVIFIELDEQERVVNVRVDAFGFAADEGS